MTDSVNVLEQERDKDSLNEIFLQYFSIDLPATPVQKESVFNDRYRVYCEKFGYEPADHFPDRIEYDAYDDHSMHCLITHISSGIPGGITAGCVRMIPTETEDLFSFSEGVNRIAEAARDMLRW